MSRRRPGTYFQRDRRISKNPCDKGHKISLRVDVVGPATCLDCQGSRGLGGMDGGLSSSSVPFAHPLSVAETNMAVSNYRMGQRGFSPNKPMVMMMMMFARYPIPRRPTRWEVL